VGKRWRVVLELEAEVREVGVSLRVVDADVEIKHQL